METDAPDEMSREIEARLGVRRRFYERALVVFAPEAINSHSSAPLAYGKPSIATAMWSTCAFSTFASHHHHCRSSASGLNQ